jgi:hypothetical protein
VAARRRLQQRDPAQARGAMFAPIRIAGLVGAFVAAACVGWLLAGSAREATGAIHGRTRFQHVVVDAGRVIDPWGKAAGDLNGDGRSDLLVGGRNGGGLVWYENPSWQRHVIRDKGAFSTDIEVADIDGDGKNDVVALMYDQLVWFRNVGAPGRAVDGERGWVMQTIDKRRLHDVEIADLDGDGRLDIVARGQSAFGPGGNQLLLYFRQPDGGWTMRALECLDGEGLKLYDVDGDGRVDAVLNGVWLRNPGARAGHWTAHRFAQDWTWPHASVAVVDINRDGRADIVLSPSEKLGGRYRIAWFEAPPAPTAIWREHVVDRDVATVHHFVGAADMDLDGHVDIVSAAMPYGDGPHEVKIYFNAGDGDRWTKQVLATTGSHNMRLLDIDADGDTDLFGANAFGTDQRVRLWINETRSSRRTP